MGSEVEGPQTPAFDVQSGGSASATTQQPQQAKTREHPACAA
jgi:hypothetical protein